MGATAVNNQARKDVNEYLQIEVSLLFPGNHRIG